MELLNAFTGLRGRTDGNVRLYHIFRLRSEFIFQKHEIML